MNNFVLSPIPYYGNKKRMLAELGMLYPKPSSYDTFIDVFGGGGTVILNYPFMSGQKNLIYNDLDPNLVELMKIIKDKEIPLKTLYDVEYSENEFEQAKEVLENSTDKIERARAKFIISSQSFEATQIAFSRKSTDTVYRDRMIRNLSIARERLKNVSISNENAFEIVEKYKDSETTMLYLDPPYIKDLRLIYNCYKYELADELHVKLVEIIKNCKCKIMLSGYSSELYDSLLKQSQWSKYTILKKSDEKRNEIVYINYPVQEIAKYKVNIG